MRSTSILKSLALGLALAGQSQALPNLLAARVNGGELVQALAALFKEILKIADVATATNTDAWDWGAHPQMCSVYMETTDGGYCKASVTCNDGVTNYYNPDGAGWSVCFVGGRQYFTDPRIGDFSITFTQADSDEGEGLTKPVLQVAGVDNWREFPVSDLARQKLDAERCKKGITPLNCDNGPFVCTWWDFGNGYIWDSRNKRWNCGVPRLGESGGGASNDGPENEQGFAPGWCGVHVAQYQKPNPATDAYGLEVTINDNNENKIGGTEGRAGPTVSLPSKLPWTLEIQTGAVDADPVTMQYGDQSWAAGSGDSRCSVGAYDNGVRHMDCGFTC